MHKLNFLKTELDSRSSNISRTEWDAYFICFFEAFQCYQEPNDCLSTKGFEINWGKQSIKGK